MVEALISIQELARMPAWSVAKKNGELRAQVFDRVVTLEILACLYWHR